MIKQRGKARIPCRQGEDEGNLMHGEKGRRCTEILLHLLTLRETLRKIKTTLVLISLFLLLVSAVGLFTLASSPTLPSPTLAYTSGLSMVFLPATFPSLLAIIPLTFRRGYRKGAAMAFLFGTGLATTLAVSGALIASSKRVFYLDRITLTMWALAGAAAYLLGLFELGLLSRRLIPPFPKGWEDGLLAFLLGLLLGNAGQSCPNLAFYTLLTSISGSGSPLQGAFLGFLHGMGRATPLIGLAIMSTVAMGAGGGRWRSEGQRIEGWGWTGVAVLLLPRSLLGQAWWEESLVHKVWNGTVNLAFGPSLVESHSAQALLGYVPPGDPWPLYGPWVLVFFLAAVPILWRWARNMGWEKRKK